MVFRRHAYLGRDDDRDDPALRTHDPRAGFAPRAGGGLDHDPSFYTRHAAGVTLQEVDDSDALGAGSIQSARHEPDPDRKIGVERARSDVAVYNDVWQALFDDRDLDVASFPRLALSVRDGEVELRGVALDDEQRRRAAEICGEIDGVFDVFNFLRVHRKVTRR
jgi:hypothetical protein